MTDVYVCTSCFNSQTVNLIGQTGLIPLIAAASAQGIELREELSSPVDGGWKQVGQAIKRSGLNAVYSAPKPLWSEGKKINTALAESMAQAGEAAAENIKFALGEFQFSANRLADMRSWLTGVNHAATGINITIENDQTVLGGSLKPLKKFMEFCEFEAFPIGLTFDIGNWHWTGEDPVEAAVLLQRFVRYIHIKQVDFCDGQPRVVPITAEATAQWRQVLRCLPADVPRTIEFPLPDSQSVSELAQYVQMLRQDI